MNTKSMIITGIFASVICIFSILTVPIGSVPITLSIFAVFLCSMVLGLKKGTAAVIIYILCGAFGLPVFSGFRGGINVLLSPTGGYITGYIFIALIMGFISDITKTMKTKKRIIFISIGCVFSMVLCYIFGTLQFSFITKTPFKISLAICVYPFIIIDTIKIFAAVFLGEILRKRMKNLDI